MARLSAQALVASLVVFGLVGCSAKASPYKSISLCDFERTADPVAESPHYDIPTALKKPNYTNHDFRWNTSGYATMQPVTKDEAKAAKNKPFYKFFQGKTAAKVRFTVPGDYKKITADNKPKAWETGMTLAIDSYTALPVTDWSPYRYLDIAAYNPGTADQKLHLRVADSAGAVTETSALVVAGGASTLEFDLAMLSDARLNTHDIRSMALLLNTADQTADPVLMFDNIGLHTGTYEDRKKAEVTDESADDEDEDWDSEDEDVTAATLKLGVVSRPSGVTGLEAATGVTPSAAAVSATAN